MMRRMFKSLRSRVVSAAAIVAGSRFLALAAFVFGAMFVVFDAMVLPVESKVGRIMKAPMRRQISFGGGGASGFAIKSDAKIRIVLRYPDEGTRILAFVDCVYEPRRTGLWAITREKYDATVNIQSPDTLSNEVLAEIRTAFCEHLALTQEMYPPYIEWVRQGRTKVDRIMWVGYLHNSITSIVALVMFGIAFLSIVRVLENRRVKLAIRAGRCSSCGYDLRGGASDFCTECGAAVTPRPPRGDGV